MNILLAGNCNWVNIIRNWIIPLSAAGFRITFLCDDEPIDPLPPTIVEYVTLRNSAIPLFGVAALCKLSIGIKSAIKQKTELKRLRHYWNRSFSRLDDLRSFLKSRKFALVHCHFLNRPVSVTALFGTLDLPIITSIHGSDLYVGREISATDRKIIERSFEKSQFIHVPGSREESAALSLGCARDKIVRKPWFFSTDSFRPPDDTQEVARLRCRWKIPLKSDVILSVRNLKPIYDLSTTLEAFSKVLSVSENCFMVIAGEGECRRELDEQARRAGLLERLMFVGRVSSADLIELYQLADLYVQSPKSDALSYSLLEALSCGLPAVSTNVGSNTDILEYINHDEPGRHVLRLFEVGNADEMARLMLRHLEQPVKRFKETPAWISRNFGVHQGIEWCRKLYELAIDR